MRTSNAKVPIPHARGGYVEKIAVRTVPVRPFRQVSGVLALNRRKPGRVGPMVADRIAAPGGRRPRRHRAASELTGLTGRPLGTGWSGVLQERSGSAGRYGDDDAVAGSTESEHLERAGTRGFRNRTRRTERRRAAADDRRCGWSELKAISERSTASTRVDNAARAEAQQERIDLAARELADVSERLQAAANALRESI